jgi:hypothetical protein
MARRVVDRTPFNHPGTNVYSLLSTAEVEHGTRLNRIRKAWRFYRGRHWRWQRDEAEPFVTFNYTRLFTDSMVYYLFGRGFKITIPDDPTTAIPEDLEREFVRHTLDEDWRRNGKDLVALEMGQQGSITGDVFVRIGWEEENLLEDPYPRIDVIPSEYVFPDFGGPHGVDRKKVNSVLILFPRYSVDSQFEKGRGLYGAQHKRVEVYGERWYPDRVLYYEGDGNPVERPNPFGEIPIVHIPNFPISGDYFGVGDLEDIIGLNQELNEKATDISDVVNYHGAPITLVSGAKLSNLERGPNRMWGLPGEAKVENLELKGDLSASMNYVAFVKKSMHELGHIPEEVLGSLQKGIRDISGSALAMRFIPLTMVRNVKIQTYGMGLRLVNRLMLRCREIKDTEFRKKMSKLKGNKYRNDVVFPDPLPRNESIDLDNAEKRLRLGLSTLSLELEKEGKSQGEITRILTGLEEDAKLKARIEFMIGSGYGPIEDNEEEEDSKGGGGNPNPVRPNPDVQGEKKSIDSEKKE